jgi:PIN domain nuclease of toxin-antitoxin system
MRTLLDTHAWLWWVGGDRRLSRRANQAIRRAQDREDLWLSMISIWEVAKKVEKRQLALDRSIEAWLDEALATPGLQVAELTRAVLVESCQLPAPIHDDPADQIIVSSARALGAVIVTRDARLREYPHARTLW